MRNRRRLALLLTAALFAALPPLVAPTASHAAFPNFITRNGDKLMDGVNEYRFLSISAAALHRNEDEVAVDESDRWPDEYEIRDQLRTIAQLGGQATRTYTLSYKRDNTMDYHVNGLNNYSETGFRTLDKVLQVAAQENVRIIFPFIDSHDFPAWGGVDTFAGFSGNSTYDFYTNSTVKTNFKALISYVLNRTNYYTGVQYKNDPTVMAWQLGNELELSGAGNSTVDAWASEIAAHIKSVDQNHLVMDGRDRNFDGVLTDANIDIVGGHYYTAWDNTADLAGLATTDRNTTRNKRPLIVDEFGLASSQSMADLEDRIISDGISGGLLWGLRGHNRYGGFRTHPETANYYSYHYPGFPSGAGYDETAVLNTLRAKAYGLRGATVPVAPVPEPPRMLPSPNVSALSWAGSTGAASYDLQRGPSPTGPWTTVATGVTDDSRPQYNDSAAPAGEHYYRVAAKNTTGTSAYSAPVGPVSTGQGTNVYGNNLALNKSVSAYWSDGSPATTMWEPSTNAVDGNPSSFAQANGRYVWQLQVDLGASQSISRIVAIMPSDLYATAFDLKTSTDGVNFSTVKSVTGFAGGTSDNVITATTARYIRVVAISPNGVGQTGGQMAISELGVYGNNLALNKSVSAYWSDGSPATTMWEPSTNAVDGNPSSFAQANGRYVWQLQVDLGASQSISRIVAIMPSDLYATAFDLKTSTDGVNFSTVKSVTGFAGGTSDNVITATTARYIRVVAITPNGVGQTGGQMAISELLVYESV